MYRCFVERVRSSTIASYVNTVGNVTSSIAEFPSIRGRGEGVTNQLLFDMDKSPTLGELMPDDADTTIWQTGELSELARVHRLVLIDLNQQNV